MNNKGFTTIELLLLLILFMLILGCAHPQKVTIHINPTATCHHKDGAPDNVVECTNTEASK